MIVFGILMNVLIVFLFCPGILGINFLFTIGLLGVMLDSVKDKKQNLAE
ncbi:MAG: hypothetical protein RR554_07305 [Vagococcus sp.]